jgi:hypothetical protein
MSCADHSEDALVEQPAIALLANTTAKCWDEPVDWINTTLGLETTVDVVAHPRLGAALRS